MYQSYSEKAEYTAMIGHLKQENLEALAKANDIKYKALIFS